jgi:tetratricopeptide (TPR) repeat protein
MSLKLADKFVKEGNYDAALNAIAEARRLDPTNPYAIAYEERVRSLQHQQKQAAATETTSKQSPPPVAPQLETLSRLAIEKQRAVSTPVARPTVRQNDEEERKRIEETRRTAIRTKCTASLNNARGFMAQEEFERALDELSRALLLEPDNADALSLQKQILVAREETRQRREQAKAAAAAAEEKLLQEQLRTEAERIQKEREDRKRKEEGARTLAQQQKVVQYLTQASALLAAGRFDDAQNELAFVVVLDPLNPQVAELNERIRAAAEAKRLAELEEQRRKAEEEERRSEALRAAILKHCENAAALSAKGEFSEALRVLTRAYVLDPGNDEIQKCENDVLAAQEESLQIAREKRKAEEELLRQKEEQERRTREQLAREQMLKGAPDNSEAEKSENQERCKFHLTRVRELLDDGQHESALAEVALAFLADPFSDAVKEAEQMVMNAQSARTQQTDSNQPQAFALSKEDSAAIATFVAEAEQFRRAQEYSRALDTLVKGFLIDPLDPSILACEEAIKREMSEKKIGENSLATHIARAEEFITRTSYEDALVEIAMGLSRYPGDKTLTELEATVWGLQTDRDSGGRRLNDPRTSAGKGAAMDLRVRNYVQAADEYARKGEFTRALDELAQAFAIDPLNEELRQMELWIRQEEQTHKGGRARETAA